MATPNASKLVINTPLCVVFSTLFSVCGNVFTHDIWCLTYYFNNSHPKYQKNSNMTPRLLTKNCNFLSHVHFHEISRRNKSIPNTGVDLGGGGAGGAHPPLEMTYGFLIQLVFCKKCGLLVLVTPFLSGAPPPKTNPGSAPEIWMF